MFARQDRESPPEDGVIVFVGSSSIRLWNLSKSFGDLGAINRGFGGSQISDVVHFAHETVLKYKPKRVVFFCGAFNLLLDNDGNPRTELYLKDRLHLNDKGYKLWSDMLAPHLGLADLARKSSTE